MLGFGHVRWGDVAGDSGLSVFKGKGKQVASEEGEILQLESEETLADRQGKILKLESEEDRKILMKVKSEEGKILKLKKEYMAAAEVGLAGFSIYIEPMVKLSEPAGKKKTKKVVVVKTLVLPAHIAFIKAMPCPVTSPELNFPEDFQDDDDYYYRKATMFVHMKLRDYRQALVDQYEKFGYVVDETELTDNEDEDEELTDDEDEDEDKTAKN